MNMRPVSHRPRRSWPAVLAAGGTLLGLLAGTATIARGQGLAVPPLSGRIVDQAELLDADAEGRIDSRLAALEADTGAQVAVLTIPSLEGQVLESFAIEVGRSWQLGQKGRDNGVLILVARDDREVRIEVGRGLEGALTDLLTNRVIDEHMVPHFRDGDFGGGIEAAVVAMDPVIRGEPMPEPAEVVLGPLAAAIVMTFWILIMSVLGLVSIAGGGLFAALVYFFLMPFSYGVPAAVVSNLAGAGMFGLWSIGYPILYFTWGRALRAARVKAFPAGGGKRSRAASDSPWSGWSGSSGGGFGGSSGGSSGGGFSGGGGGFSGGGASGRW